MESRLDLFDLFDVEVTKFFNFYVDQDYVETHGQNHDERTNNDSRENRYNKVYYLFHWNLYTLFVPYHSINRQKLYQCHFWET